ncbi:MAG: hypothetical protein JNK04_19570, partial [Myxococcales bacterium]|nr:hypothetical protein [Myxococcales bacterium]
CWGLNIDGQCGVEESALVLTPTRVPLPVDVGEWGITALAAGEYHTCAGLSDGRVLCWGDNSSGQLGIGEIGGFHVPPTLAPGFETFTALTAGDFFTCGSAQSGGAVRCVGQNFKGQLGNGGDTDSGTPVPIDEAPAMAAVDAGGFGVIAMPQQSDGVALWGWGEGVLLGGVQPDSVSSPTPLQISAGWAMGRFSAGLVHVCAVASQDGTGVSYDTLCWGANGSGQLGNGSTNQSAVPVGVVGLPGDDRVVSIAAGGLHTCAVTEQARAYCWGSNSAGQIGNGVVGGESLTAALVMFP